MGSTTVILASTLSAIFTAVLGYLVRTKAKAAEYKERQRKIAHSYFLLLTDTIATDKVIRTFIGIYTKDLPPTGPNYDLLHELCVKASDHIAKADPEDLSLAYANIKPLLNSGIDLLGKLTLSPTQVAELPEETIFFYNRYASMALRLQFGVKVIDSIVERKQFGQLNPEALHGFFHNYVSLVDASGILREAFKDAANLSNAYSAAAFQRSVKAHGDDMMQSMTNKEKLAAAQKAVFGEISKAA